MLDFIHLFDNEFKTCLEKYRCAKRYHEDNILECRIDCEKYIKQLQDAKHVAIFDDVFTTGSTVESLCDLLLEIGVKRVDIYCICRTPEPTKTKVGAQK